MRILFSLNAAEMNRACSNLGTKLAVSSDSRTQHIDFTITARSVDIRALRTLQRLPAKVHREGTVSIPRSVIEGVIRILPYFGSRNVQIVFSTGKMHIENLVFHNRMIALRGSNRIEGRNPTSKRQSLLGRAG